MSAREPVSGRGAAGKAAVPDQERAYYLHTLRDRVIVIAAVDDSARGECVRVGEEIANEAGAHVVVVERSTANAMPGSDGLVLEVWRSLKRANFVRVEVADVRVAAALVASGGRVNKLVMVGKGLALETRDGARRSFVDVGAAGLPGDLIDVARPLYEGVDGVNLCEPGGLSAELFTYTGSGTLLTNGDYGEIRRLGYADYTSAASVLARGVALGYLRERSDREVEDLLPRAFGFFTAGPAPAGVVALDVETYSDAGCGELEALFTISRFHHEGVGRRLVEAVFAAARESGLEAVFAVSANPLAIEFFEICGFEPVEHDELPTPKWQNYPSERRGLVTPLLYKL